MQGHREKGWEETQHPVVRLKVSWHGSAAVRQRIPHRVMGDFIMTTEPVNQEIATALDVSTSTYRMLCVKGGTGTARENGWVHKDSPRPQNKHSEQAGRQWGRKTHTLLRADLVLRTAAPAGRPHVQAPHEARTGTPRALSWKHIRAWRDSAKQRCSPVRNELGWEVSNRMKLKILNYCNW